MYGGGLIQDTIDAAIVAGNANKATYSKCAEQCLDYVRKFAHIPDHETACQRKALISNEWTLHCLLAKNGTEYLHLWSGLPIKFATWHTINQAEFESDRTQFINDRERYLINNTLDEALGTEGAIDRKLHVRVYKGERVYDEFVDAVNEYVSSNQQVNDAIVLTSSSEYIRSAFSFFILHKDNSIVSEHQVMVNDNGETRSITVDHFMKMNRPSLYELWVCCDFNSLARLCLLPRQRNARNVIISFGHHAQKFLLLKRIIMYVFKYISLKSIASVPFWSWSISELYEGIMAADASAKTLLDENGYPMMILAGKIVHIRDGMSASTANCILCSKAQDGAVGVDVEFKNKLNKYNAAFKGCKEYTCGKCNGRYTCPVTKQAVIEAEVPDAIARLSEYDSNDSESVRVKIRLE
jgi:hypothetical protein